MAESQYPIGTAGIAWGEAEKSQWLEQQTKQRSFESDVLSQVRELESDYEVTQYGELEYQGSHYPLLALKHRDWQPGRAIALVTGGVHGYETSGVHGALAFAKNIDETHLKHFNIIVVPCISPWGYETINRWNAKALDPNRSFYEGSGAGESEQLLAFITPFKQEILVHVDLHETTDTDNSEFRPALAARDGITNSNWNIPDGFYLCADKQRPQSEFQRAVNESVAKVTHIAPADENNQLIGTDITQEGVIEYDAKKLGLCMGLTDAPYVTTTEVYPDSPKSDAQNCIDAQVAAVDGALHFVAKL